MLGRAAIARKLGALSVAVLWLDSTTWHAMHQRTASLPPTERSCAVAGNASSAEANTIASVLRICFTHPLAIVDCKHCHSLKL